MNSWQIVITLSRPFDVEINGKYLSGVRTVKIPFATILEADDALTQMVTEVREVHDAGGEDYRPVVPGVVLGSASELMGKHVLIGEIERGDGNADT